MRSEQSVAEESGSFGDSSFFSHESPVEFEEPHRGSLSAREALAREALAHLDPVKFLGDREPHEPSPAGADQPCFFSPQTQAGHQEERDPYRACPADNLLVYSNLILAGPEEGDRGVLRLQQPIEMIPRECRHQREVLASLGLDESYQTKKLVRLQAQELPTGVISVEESAGGLAYRFMATFTSGIPADGRFHRAMVLRTSLPAHIVYRTLPEIDPAVYRLAILSNPIHRPLLAGDS